MPRLDALDSGYLSLGRPLWGIFLREKGNLELANAPTNLDSRLKSRDTTLPTKVRLVKAMVFQWSCMDVRVGL